MSEITLQGKISKNFNYEVVPGSSTLGSFVTVPNEGDFTGKTIAIDIEKRTLLNGCVADALELDKILIEGYSVEIILKDLPSKIQTQGWTAVAEYSAQAISATVNMFSVEENLNDIHTTEKIIGIPTSVNNVTVYPYIEWPKYGGVGPVIPPVIENAKGTYRVSTLATDVNYNLNLENVKNTEAVVVNSKYTANWDSEDGKTFVTLPLVCLTSGSNPTFGLTVDLLKRNSN